MTYRQIARYLNDLNYKTKYDNDWELRMIKYMLKNPTYCGYTRWCPERHDTHKYNFEKSIIVKSNFEPIISEELFKKAQDKVKHIEKIHRKYEKKTTNKHWLSNLIECSHCGKKLSRSSGNYFQCCGYSKGQCKNSQSIAIKVLEKVVLKQLENIYLTKIDVVFSKNNYQSNNELFLLEKQLEKTNDKEKRIKEAYQSGIDTLEEYKQNKTELKKEKENIKQEINKIEKNNNEKSKKDDIIRISSKLHELLQDKNTSIDDKYNAIHLIIDKMIFNRQEKTLAIYFRKDYTKDN